ncbi:unnamed protein product [Oncorhynchus mykiss]|uniref:Tetraspanin n=1 Tax=Oncorhynchus mykiss TaxID=8022 RepID=A0A060YK21_ONCMY|nr:unnamed protein product [Oncorhynchus mykiss]
MVLVCSMFGFPLCSVIDMQCPCFRCCGVTNHTDWFDVYNASRVPDSCCLEYSDNCGLENPGTWWTAPCYERVKDWLQENLVALWIFALCTALTQVQTLVTPLYAFHYTPINIC